jgi:hypothetical protein
MPVVEYTNQPPPDHEEYRRELREARETYDPLEELLRLHGELGDYERRYGFPSGECYQRFTAGQMGDDPDIFAWVGRYKAFLRIKAAIAEGLNTIIINEPSVTTTV